MTGQANESKERVSGDKAGFELWKLTVITDSHRGGDF